MEQLELSLHESVGKNTKPNCWNCKNFAISWVKESPYKCNFIGTMHKNMPILNECNNFTPKSS
jgi:hypothetical protein